MIPKEKARELVKSMSFSTLSLNGMLMGEWVPISQNKFAKECALIAVNEILDLSYWSFWESEGEVEEKYWNEVKQEIEKL